MCGIYGTTLKHNIELLKNKIGYLHQRGPDFQDLKNYDQVTLGHARLSIIDLYERSNQPFDYGDISITFNGEIYNFLELKEDLKKEGYKFETTSDTEVICALYLSKGKECVDFLNGMFAFVIYDKKENTLFGARDRMGQKPLYYFYDKNHLEFSSSLYAVASGNNLELDRNAIKAYLEWGYVPEPMSMFKKVYKLEPGYAFSFSLNNRSFEKWQYWDIPGDYTEEISFSSALDTLDSILTKSVKSRMISDVSLGVFLSGGVDSSLIAAIAQKNSQEKLKTFCIGFEESQFDESKYAENIADYLGTDHTTIILSCDKGKDLIKNMQSYYDEPHDDTSDLGQLLLSEATRKHVTVALSGDGGDEFFLGYNQYQIAEEKRKLYSIPALFRSLFSLPFALSNNHKYFLISKALKLKSIEEFHRIYYSQLDRRWLTFERFKQENEKYMFSKKPLLERLSDFDIKTYMCGDILTKVDRATMAYSLEARSPILDYKVLEFAKKLPVEYKYKNGQKKTILRELLSRYLPKELYERPKQGFAIPVSKWFRNELKPYLLEILTKDAFADIPEIEYDFFKKIMNDHFTGKWNNTSKIYRVLMLVQWLKKYKKI